MWNLRSACDWFGQVSHKELSGGQQGCQQAAVQVLLSLGGAARSSPALLAVPGGTACIAHREALPTCAPVEVSCDIKSRAWITCSVCTKRSKLCRTKIAFSDVNPFLQIAHVGSIARSNRFSRRKFELLFSILWVEQGTKGRAELGPCWPDSSVLLPTDLQHVQHQLTLSGEDWVSGKGVFRVTLLTTLGLCWMPWIPRTVAGFLYNITVLCNNLAIKTPDLCLFHLSLPANANKRDTLGILTLQLKKSNNKPTKDPVTTHNHPSPQKGNCWCCGDGKNLTIHLH